MNGAPFERSPLRGDGESRTFDVRIPDDLAYLDGHFPGNPIVPGVAQLLPLVHDPVRQAWPDLGRCIEVRRLKFLGALKPGHSILVELRRSGERISFEISRDGQRCTRGVLLFETP